MLNLEQILREALENGASYKIVPAADENGIAATLVPEGTEGREVQFRVQENAVTIGHHGAYAKPVKTVKVGAAAKAQKTTAAEKDQAAATTKSAAKKSAAKKTAAKRT